MTTSDIAVVRRVRARVGRRRRLLIGVLTLLLGAAFAARVLGGDYTVTLPDFIAIVQGHNIPGASFIVMESKLPRAVSGILAGAAFGLSGALFQSVLRNPLASPDIIGISAGASTGAVVAVVSLGLTGLWVPLFAVSFAIAASVAIAVCAGGPGARLVLVGVAVTAALIAVIQYLLTRATIWDAQVALLWLTGSLNQTTWAGIGLYAGVWAVLVGLTWALAGSLPALEMGEDTSAALGEQRNRSLTLLLVGVLLVATATALTGPIAFVALLALPIARRLNGGGISLVAAAVTGALIVVVADYLAAYAIPDLHLPVGVVTGLLGAPFLLWLIIVDKRRTG